MVAAIAKKRDILDSSSDKTTRRCSRKEIIPESRQVRSTWRKDLEAMHISGEGRLKIETDFLETSEREIYLIKQDLFRHFRKIVYKYPEITLKDLFKEFKQSIEKQQLFTKNSDGKLDDNKERNRETGVIKGLITTIEHRFSRFPNLKFFDLLTDPFENGPYASLFLTRSKAKELLIELLELFSVPPLPKPENKLEIVFKKHVPKNAEKIRNLVLEKINGGKSTETKTSFVLSKNDQDPAKAIVLEELLIHFKNAFLKASKKMTFAELLANLEKFIPRKI